MLLHTEFLTRRFCKTPGQRRMERCRSRQGGSRCALFATFWQRSRVAAAKTQRIVRTIEPPSRHTAIAPPSCRAVPVASPRHCRAVPVASLKHRPVAPLGRHPPHRHSVACRRVVTPPPATAPSSRRLPPRRRPVALLHHRPAPNMKRGTRRCLAQFAMSAARPSPGPGSTGRSASCG